MTRYRFERRIRDLSLKMAYTSDRIQLAKLQAIKNKLVSLYIGF